MTGYQQFICRTMGKSVAPIASKTVDSEHVAQWYCAGLLPLSSLPESDPRVAGSRHGSDCVISRYIVVSYPGV